MSASRERGKYKKLSRNKYNQDIICKSRQQVCTSKKLNGVNKNCATICHDFNNRANVCFVNGRQHQLILYFCM